MELTLQEKEILCRVIEKMRELYNTDKTIVYNIKQYNFDLATVACAVAPSVLDILVDIEATNKRKYNQLNSEFKRLINKLF